MVLQFLPRSRTLRDRFVKRLVRSILLFTTTVGLLLLVTPWFSASRTWAAEPGMAQRLNPAPTYVSQMAKQDSAGRLGQPLQTDYASYCQAHNGIEKPICGGVGEGEETPVSRTDFVLESENAPLEPIVLYQYDKTVLLQSGF